MAEEKKAEEKKADEKGKGEEKAKDPNEKLSKKNKIILFAGIGGVLLLIIAIGSFVVYKTMKAKAQAEFEMAQEAGPVEVGPDGKVLPAKDGKPQDAPKDDHGKDDGHGKKDEKKDDGHGKKDEKKDDGHGKKDEKKDDGHGKKDEKKDDHGKKDDGHGKKDDKKEETKSVTSFGDTFTIPKMDLNLGNPVENRFLRIGVGMEYRGGEEQQEELKKREIQIKDIIITTVTNKTRVQLLTPSGKELLRREILNRINEVSDRPIQNVFFTEFLVE
jgi:flagellar basal body-associated protein FliL